jgi:transcriptional regulator with GAF, ATPase, and Fis domain
MCDLLAARAALLVSLPSAIPPAQAGFVHTMLRAEIALASGEPTDAAVPELSLTCSKDAIIAAALVALARFVDPKATPLIITGAKDVASREDARGYQHLVVALDAEARGESGLPMLERALAVATERGSRALEHAALRMREAACARRGAASEEQATRAKIIAMTESWILALGPTDAASAAARPDRRRLTEPRGVASAASLERIVDVALALAQERNVDRLANLALDTAMAEARAERGVLFLSDASSGQTIAATRFADASAAERGILGLSSTLARRVIESGEAIVSHDVRVDPRLSKVDSLGVDVTSVLCAPIVARAAVEGAIYIDRRFQGSPFDADAVSVVRAIGAMLASSLVTARTVRELEGARAELADALATRTVQRDQAQRELAEVRDHVPAGTSGLVGRGPAMKRLLETIARIAPSDVPVLVWGETGTGKELVARAIHDASARRDRPLVALNCGALSESLLEAELFGAERGAYTSAVSARPGVLVAADGGTLFLDEVGDMPMAMQVALLRVLETGEVRPVGGTKTRKVDVRVIAASHHDLVALERKGSFRADLRFRLEVVRVEVPALRDRLEDMPELTAHLIAEVRKRYNLPMRRLSREALDALRNRSWDGNVRELRHVLASAALSATGEVILPTDLPTERSGKEPSPNVPSPEVPEDGHAARADAIRRALRSTAGRRSAAAQLLGLSRSTFYRYLELYRIDPKEFGAPMDEKP